MVIQSAGQLNTSFPFVSTFGAKIPVQMFAYLILKLLGTFQNVYRSLDVCDKKSASLEQKHRLDRERPIWKTF